MGFAAIYIILLSVLVLALSVYLLNRRRDPTSFYLFALSVTVIVWLLPFGLLPLYQGNPQAQTWLVRISTMAGAWHPAAIFFVIDSIVSRRASFSRFSIVFLLTASLLTSILDATPLVIQSASLSDHGLDAIFGRGVIPVTVWFLALYVIFPIRGFIQNYRLSSGRERIKMKYIALSLVVAILIEQTTNTILPVFFNNTSWYLVGCSVCLFAVGLTYYGLAENQLYDLDLIWGRFFKSQKYAFHQLMEDFIHQLPLLMSHEKIVSELSQRLQSRVGLEFFSSSRRIYGTSGKLETMDGPASADISSVLRAGQLVSVQVSDADTCRVLQQHDLEAAVPLLHDGKLIGALCLGQGSSDILYSKQDYEQLRRLGMQLSLASKIIDHQNSEMGRLQETIARLKPVTLGRMGLRESGSVVMHADERFPLVGGDESMRQLFDQLAFVATYDTPVLIAGETGTGKENLARLIHRESGRDKFVPVNCSAIPENLLESELFGFARGAFTGADRAKSGLIVEADGGTLFLDEIGEMPLMLQAKLLRFLQDGSVRPLGSTEMRKVNVRVVAATNRRLEELVASGLFREDLYYRLKVLHFQVPALRERSKDIFHLADFFLSRFNSRYDKKCRFSRQILARFRTYSWPGNVRELENMIHRLVCMAGPTDVLHDMPEAECSATTAPRQTAAKILEDVDLSIGLREILERTKREIIEQALRSAPSHKEAADLLKLKPANLSMYIKKMGIERPPVTA